MVVLTNQEIKEIAEQLSIGMNCYYNVKSKKIIVIPDYTNENFYDDGLWEEVKEEIDNEFEDLIRFEPMSTRDSFQVMEEFIDCVRNNRLRDRLIDALNRSKPFRNFKNIIDDSGDYRQEWFEFRDQKYNEFVEKQIEDLNKQENISDYEHP